MACGIRSVSRYRCYVPSAAGFSAASSTSILHSDSSAHAGMGARAAVACCCVQRGAIRPSRSSRYRRSARCLSIACAVEFATARAPAGSPRVREVRAGNGGDRSGDRPRVRGTRRTRRATLTRRHVASRAVLRTRLRARPGPGGGFRSRTRRAVGKGDSRPGCRGRDFIAPSMCCSDTRPLLERRKKPSRASTRRRTANHHESRFLRVFPHRRRGGRHGSRPRNTGGCAWLRRWKSRYPSLGDQWR